MKLKIQTQNFKEVREKLDEFVNKLVENPKNNGQIFATYTIDNDNKNFILEIKYLLENRLANKIMEREFKKTFKKIDENIIFERVKE